MAYSRTKINNCLNLVNQITETVASKKDHFAKWAEIKEVFDFCYENTNCILFSTNFSFQYEDYAKAVSNNETKKVLDNHLKACVRYLQKQVYAIKMSMDLGEIETIQ